MNSSASNTMTVDSPVGPLELTADGDALVRIDFAPSGRVGAQTLTPASRAVLSAAKAELGAYFDGRLRAFTFPMELRGGTAFQREVWTVLRAIPFGERVSYGDIARAVGRPRAVRAVGAANGANPLAIVVPCHRVIGADGTLTGYAGGVDRKRWLLEHEASIDARLQNSAARGARGYGIASRMFPSPVT